MRLVLFFFLLLAIDQQGVYASVEPPVGLNNSERDVEDLVLIKRETKKSKVIPIGANVLVKLEDSEVQGTLLGLRHPEILIEDKEGKEISVSLNDIKSIGHRTSASRLKGIGVAILGTVMVAGGVAFAVGSPEPVLGIMGAVSGVGVISMCPSVFKYGKRYHLDGEWMVERKF